MVHKKGSGCTESKIEETKNELHLQAEKLNLKIMSSEEYKTFIKMLGEKVNKYIEW